MIGIYKIINPKGRIYIGQSKNIDRRITQYRNFIGNSSSVGPILLNSFKKYGWNEHVLEIIEECSLEQLDERETYWKIHYLNLVNNDWNKVLFCELYDSGGGPKSDITKHKQSLSHQNNLIRPEILEKRKINCKIAANNPGVQLRSIQNTDWESRNRNFRKSASRVIIQYDLDGNLIKEWECGMDVQKELGYKGFWATEITKTCKHTPDKPYKGYIWKYKFPDEIKIKQRPVNQYNIDGSFIKEWENPSKAARYLELSGANLYKCLKGEYKTFGGYKWKYKDEISSK
jgi:group I intron endonuclease